MFQIHMNEDNGDIVSASETPDNGCLSKTKEKGSTMIQINQFKQRMKKGLRGLLLKGAAVLSRDRQDESMEEPKVYVRQVPDLPDSENRARGNWADSMPSADTDTPVFTPSPIMDEIRLTQYHDIEKFAEDEDVSHEAVEKLISAGLLVPDEIRAAEKLARIMRQRGDGS
jgi:hypothetical protein